MSESIVREGDRVKYRDTYGVWHDGRALSGIEPTYDIDPKTRQRRKVHDFPVIWVSTRNGRVPWPAEDVKLVEAARAGS